MAFSANGSKVVSDLDDITVRFWDSFTGQALQILESHPSWVISVITRDGSMVLSGSDEIVGLWDIATSQALQTLESHSRVLQPLLTDLSYVQRLVASDQFRACLGLCMRVRYVIYLKPC